MRKFAQTIAAGATAATCLAATLATAQPFEGKGEVGGWNVFFNGATGGCFMEQAQGPLVVQLGTEAAMLGEGEGASFGFLAVYTTNEAAEIEDGEIWPIVMEIDGDLFGGEAMGVVREDVRGGYVVSRDIGFGDDLANGQTLNIVTPAGAVVEIDLTGTKAAMQAVRDCQSEMSGG
jgi:hypothetical protein